MKAFWINEKKLPKQLQEDAKAIGKKEERNIANAQLAAKDDELQNKDATINSLRIKQIQTEISLYETQRKSLEKDLHSVRQKQSDYQSLYKKYKSQSDFIKRGLYSICLLLIIIAIILGFVLRENKMFNFWVFLVPLIPIAISYFFLVIKLKEPKIVDLVNTIGENYYFWRLKEKGYDNEYQEQLNIKALTLEEDIKKLNDKTEGLMEEYNRLTSYH